MTGSSTSSRAYLLFHLRAEELLPDLVAAFKAGKPMKWPVVRKTALHRVWGDFVAHGRVRDEQALDAIFESMRDSLCHLLVANVVSGHEAVQPASYLDGTRPLLDAVALAAEAPTLEARLKHLDRALHVVHMRGDLSRLFVEGGRATVLDVGLEEQSCEA